MAASAKIFAKVLAVQERLDLVGAYLYAAVGASILLCLHLLATFVLRMQVENELLTHWRPQLVTDNTGC